MVGTMIWQSSAVYSKNGGRVNNATCVLFYFCCDLRYFGSFMVIFRLNFVYLIRFQKLYNLIDLSKIEMAFPITNLQKLHNNTVNNNDINTVWKHFWCDLLELWNMWVFDMGRSISRVAASDKHIDCQIASMLNSQPVNQNISKHNINVNLHMESLHANTCNAANFA